MMMMNDASLTMLYCQQRSVRLLMYCQLKWIVRIQLSGEKFCSNRSGPSLEALKIFRTITLLQFFLTHVLFGSCALDVSEMRDKEVNKMVDVACQLVVQNTRTDRQVKHQPKANEGLKQTVKTPLSVGLPLAIHSRVRDKNLVSTLSDVYIRIDYKLVLDIEKRVEQSVLQRIV